MFEKAALFANTKSRRGKEWFDDAKRTLINAGLNLERVKAFSNPKEISPAVQKAVADGFPLVVLGGGDGTFSATVKHFVGSEATLGVLPFGTGNAFARDLGIGFSVEESCKTILEGQPLQVDLGLAGNDYFVNVTTVGLTVRIAEELSNDAKKRFGRFVYAIALFRAMTKVKPFRAVLTTETGEHEMETMQVVIGSGRFHAGPFPVAPDATITDGRLNIYALESTSKWALLKMALRLPGGRHVELKEVAALTSKGGTLKTTPIQQVNVDGEIGLRTPLHFGIAPKAIKVMAPGRLQLESLNADIDASAE